MAAATGPGPIITKDGLEEAYGHNSTREKHDSGQPPQQSSEKDTIPTSPRVGHQRLVFSDPVAFRYLEEDPSTVVLDRRRRLEGYEIYLVEQWACSRVHPTFIIATYTGDPSHSILVSVLSVPTDESTWSSRLRVYFKAISQFHARKKETPIGTLMVTNLSGFPSSLTVIAVPDGDVKKHREDFIVNEDLKRLGCSGRAGLNIQYPASATVAKFHQLYRISDRIPLYNSVMELVKLCQVALIIFAKLAPEYADGLLCDVTEKAVNDWWTDIGTDIYNVEPSDGILGPTTVSALLGLLMGGRNRLNAYGAPVSKDPFDVLSLKRGVAYFQKSQKLEKTRRLDRQTLEKLHRVTAKAASGDGWTVPKAVKSTVAELSGKGGEMVMGMVGARDKAGIAEVETLDIDRFVQLVHGERAKWLWHGKPRKAGSGDIFDHINHDDGMIFSRDQQGGYVWASRKRDSVADGYAPRSTQPSNEASVVQGPPAAFDDKDQQSKRGMLKGATGRGFGRFKDAVGLPRSHHHKHSKEDAFYDYEGADLSHRSTFGSELTLNSTRSAQPPSPVLPAKSKNNLGQPFQPTAEDYSSKAGLTMPSQHSDIEPQSQYSTPPNEEADQETPATTAATATVVEGAVFPGSNMYPEQINRLSPINRKKYDEILMDIENLGPAIGPSLRKTESSDSLAQVPVEQFLRTRWPRQLSFSTVEEALLTWEEVSGNEPIQTSETIPPALAMSRETATTIEARIMGAKVSRLEQMVRSWVEEKVKEIDELDQSAGSHQDELKTLYYQRLDHCQALRAGTDNLMIEDRSSLTQSLREVEVLGAKLEYELNALQSRVNEVEDGVAEFERHVLDSEARMNELTEEKHDTSLWTAWLPDFLTGARKAIGKGEQ